MDKAKLKREYKDKLPIMGIYKIEVLNVEKFFIGYTTDFSARFNRHKFDLKFGSHRNRELQKVWNSKGENDFKFVILDELEYDKNRETNLKEELELLLEMWNQKLKENSIPFELLK